MTGSQPIEYVPPKRIASLNTFGIGTPFWRGEMSARKRFWMITLIAKLENSSVTKLAPRSGRKAMRSISTPAIAAATTAEITSIGNGTPCSLSR